jgi:hypothetical protein
MVIRWLPHLSAADLSIRETCSTTYQDINFWTSRIPSHQAHHKSQWALWIPSCICVFMSICGSISNTNVNTASTMLTMHRRMYFYPGEDLRFLIFLRRMLYVALRSWNVIAAQINVEKCSPILGSNSHSHVAECRWGQATLLFDAHECSRPPLLPSSAPPILPEIFQQRHRTFDHPFNAIQRKVLNIGGQTVKVVTETRWKATIVKIESETEEKFIPIFWKHLKQTIILGPTGKYLRSKPKFAFEPNRPEPTRLLQTSPIVQNFSNDRRAYTSTYASSPTNTLLLKWCTVRARDTRRSI